MDARASAAGPAINISTRSSAGAKLTGDLTEEVDEKELMKRFMLEHMRNSINAAEQLKEPPRWGVAHVAKDAALHPKRFAAR